MDMRALRAPVIKFSVDGFGRLVAGDFDAPHTPVTSIDGRQHGGNVGNCIERLAVSDLHASPPGGRPGTASWEAGPAGRLVVVFAGPGGPTPTTVSAWRPARCLVVLGTALAIPVNRYSREFETVQSGSPFSTGLSTKPQASTEKLESSCG